jgi:hypothetical protein
MIKICRSCNHHFLPSDVGCPHCKTETPRRASGIPMFALLMGLGMTACGDKDTAEEDTAEETDTSEPSDMALYGVGMVDNDDDGFEV